MHVPYVISQVPYGSTQREGTTCKSLLIEPYGNCEIIYGKCIGLYLGSIWALYGNCENIGSGNARGASGARGSQQKDPSAHLAAGLGGQRCARCVASDRRHQESRVRQARRARQVREVGHGRRARARQVGRARACRRRARARGRQLEMLSPEGARGRGRVSETHWNRGKF